MIKLFIEGGLFWMSLLTLELIGLLLAAWKAPGWVKEAGIISVVTGFLGFLFGISQMAGAIQGIGDISDALIFGGLKVALITLIYGTLIYLASLVIRIVQKPRLL